MGFLLSVISSNLFYHYILAASQVMIFMFIVVYLRRFYTANLSEIFLSRFKDKMVSIKYWEAEK